MGKVATQTYETRASPAMPTTCSPLTSPTPYSTTINLMENMNSVGVSNAMSTDVEKEK